MVFYMDCVFCKIIDRKISASIVYENDKIVVFKDIEPLAPIHLLVVPKKHIPSVDNLGINDKELIGDIILTAQKIARSYGLDKSGYKLVFNVGKGAGQMIDHLHLHLLGGWKNFEESQKPDMP